VLTVAAVQLLRLPLLKLAGSGALLWIALQLLMPEGEGSDHATASGGLGSAIRTILVADLVMSLDNVIAVAVAAKGSTLLLVVGLAVSIPLVVFASTLLLTLMTRYPLIITLGAGLLGYVAGEMAISDPLVQTWIDTNAAWLHVAAPVLGAAGVVAVGRWWAHRAAAAALAAAPPPAAAVPAAGAVRRILLAVDGSAATHKVLEHALAMRSQLRDPASIEFHLANVQPSLPGDVSGFVDKAALHEHHHAQSEGALQAARVMLQQAGASFEEHEVVGAAGVRLAELAHSTGCELIVMGSRGLGPQASALMGSVAQSTIEHASVPVLVVK
jgi:YjbE family integral membrane protein